MHAAGPILPLLLVAAAVAAFAAAWWTRFSQVLPLERELARLRRRSDLRLREVHALHDAAEAIVSGGGGAQKALAALVSIIARTVDADLVAFLLHDEAAGDLVTQPGAFGLDREELLYRLPLSEEGSSSVRVFRTGEPFLSGDAQNDPAVLTRYARLWQIHSLIVVPISCDGRRLGVLRVGSRKRQHFTAEHLELARAVAEEAAVLVSTAVLNRRLAEAAEQLQAANRMKDDFVSTVSHEFKTPLTTINGFLAVLLDGEAGPLGEAQRRFLQTAQNAARRLGTLVSELLDLSKLQGGTLLDLKSVDMGAVARASVERHQPQAAGEQRALSLDVEAGLPPVLADAAWLGLVVDNLISNGLKFTRPGGRVAVALRRRGPEVELCVEDDGMGIAPEELPRIFEKFYRAKNTQTVSVPGTGLGLAIAGEVVARHRGRIWAESSAGRGARFYVTLPALIGGREAPAAASRVLAALAAALALSSCAERQLRPGAYKQGLAVEVEGRAPDTGRPKEALAAAAANAERVAVGSLLEYYAPIAAIERSSAAVEGKILSRARTFVKRRRIVAQKVDSGVARGRWRLLIDLPKLAKELDAAGLLRPDGVRGKPKLLIALSEEGGASAKGVGFASEALRRVLLEHGYMAVDFSDPMNKETRKKGDQLEAVAAAKGLGAEMLIWGKASARPAPDERLALYQPYEATLSLSALWTDGLKPAAAFEQKATAVDLDAHASAAKALANAGELAAQKLREQLGQSFQERTELAAAFVGLGLQNAPRLINAVRGLPGVAAVALEAAEGRDVKLRVFVETMSADELAALLLRAPGFRFDVRAVEPDFRYVEMSTGGSF